VQGRHVLVVGDSLLWQSTPALRSGLGHPSGTHAAATVDVSGFPGTALCDWSAGLPGRARDDNAAVVVLEFSGNNFTPCMRDAAGHALDGAARIAKYRDDTRALVHTLTAAGRRVVLVGAPAGRNRPYIEDIAGLYQHIAQDTPGVRFVDAGAVVAPGGVFATRLPCEAGDDCPSGHTVSVRSSDGLHFCDLPTGAVGGTDPCAAQPVGAHRFGAAIAAGVLAVLDDENRA
jgi:hypothetical protein